MKSILFIPLTVLTCCLSAQNPCTDINLDLGPDATVCIGAAFTLNPHPIEGNYQWFGSQGLDCTNCPSPTFSATSTGVFILVCILETPVCNDTDIIRINVVNGQWPQVNIAPDTSLCKNALFAPGGPGFPNQLYSWTSIPSGFNSTIANPLPFPQPASVVYYLSTIHPSCPLTRKDSVVVQVFDPPQISISGGAVICLGDSVVLGNTIPQPNVTYLWSPNNGTISDVHAPNPTAKPVTAGTNLYTLKASNSGCSVQNSVSIVAIDLDLSFDVPDTVTICQGQSVVVHAQVTPPGTAAVLWELQPNMVLSPDGLTLTVTPPTSILVKASAKVASCKKTEQVYIRVDSLPQLQGLTPAEVSICKGESILLQSPATQPPIDPLHFPDIVFSWIPGNAATDTFPYLQVQPADTTVYVRYVRNGVCQDSAKSTVNVVTGPEVDIMQDMISVCPDSLIQLIAMATGADSIRWTPSAGLSCHDCLTPELTPAGNLTLTLTAYHEGCTAEDSVKIAFTPLPQYQFPTDLNWCVGESIPLNALNDPSVQVYHWSSNPPKALDQTAQPVDMPQLIGIQTITYYLEADNGCAVSDSFKVTVTGAGLTVSDPDTICPGTQTVLTSTAVLGGGQFQWTTGDNGQVITVMPMQTATYTVSYTINDCVFQDSILLTVEGEIPELVFPPDAELCAGETLTLNAAATPGATYVWNATDGSYQSQEQLPAPFTPDHSAVYTVTATSEDGCVLKDTLAVIVHTGTLSVDIDSLLICGGTPFSLTASATEPGDFYWSPAGVSSAFLSDTLVIPQKTTYYVTYTQGSPGNECVSTDSVFIEVLKGFDIRIASDPDTAFNAGEAVFLDAVLIPSQSTNGFTFTWTEGANQPVGNTQQVTTTTTTTDTTVTYKVVVVYSNGCSQTESITFRVYQPVVAYPNAFTPNGDGSNDVFRLAVQEGVARVESFEIYNRWGNKVFESFEPDASWDGRVNGHDAPSDVYVFKIRWRRGDGSLVPKSGQVILLR